MADQPHSVPPVGPVPTQIALGAAVSPDGRYILTASSDNTARLWLTDYQDAIHAVCALLTRDCTLEERTQFDLSDQGQLALTYDQGPDR